MKRIVGLRSSLKCEICDEKIAFFRCKICGRNVCVDHYNAKKSICEICEMSICQLCNSRLSVGYCSVCGRLICEECTAYNEGGKRICKECFSKLQSKNVSII